MREAQPHGVVLVIEDDPALRGMVVDFPSAAGHATLEAADGDVGLDLATRHVPDVILLDLALPEGRARTCCGRSKRTSGHDTSPCWCSVATPGC